MLQVLRRIAGCKVALFAILWTLLLLGFPSFAQAGGDAQYWNNRGTEYFKIGKITEAIDSFKKSISLNPNSDAPHGNLGLIYLQFKAYNDALAEYQTASKLNPGNSVYHFKMGQLYFEKKSYTKAIPAFEKSLAIRPTNDEANYYLSQIYTLQNKPDAALAELKKAFKLKPNEMKYHLAIGDIYLKKGRFVEALSEFSRVKEDPGSNPELKARANKKIESIGKAIRDKKLRGLLFVVVIIFGGALLAWVFHLMIHRRQVQLELKALARAKMDTDTLNGVANYALQQLLILTQMSRGAVFFAENDFTLLRPYASAGIPSSQVGSLEMSQGQLPEWFQRIGGQPFAVASERMEAAFNEVFPDSGNFLEEMHIKIGIPFIRNNKLYGIAYIGCKKLSPRLARIFEKNLALIIQTMLEVGESIENIRLYLLSVTDELTQVYNKRYFRETAKNMAQKALLTGSPFSLLLLDIDNFSKINDTYGRLQGDVVLKRLTGRIKPILRENLDSLSRFGGEEFGILLPSVDIERTIALAEEICRTVAEMQLPHPIPSITVSLGVATFPAHARTPEELFARADEALFVSKNSGKNKVTISTGMSAGKSPAFIGETLREEENAPSNVKPWTIPTRDLMPPEQGSPVSAPPEVIFGEAPIPQQIPAQPKPEPSSQIISPWSAPRPAGPDRELSLPVASWDLGPAKKPAEEGNGTRTIPLAPASPWEPPSPQSQTPPASAWGQSQTAAPQPIPITPPSPWEQPQQAPAPTVAQSPVQPWGLPGSGIPPPPPPAPPLGTKNSQKKPALPVGWGPVPSSPAASAPEEPAKAIPSVSPWETPAPQERIEPLEPIPVPSSPQIPAAPKAPLVPSMVAGYCSRDYFERALGDELRKSYQDQKPCSVIFFAIDEIRKIRFDNPDTAQALITQVTEQIGFFLKEGADIPACYEEDTFAIILPRTSSSIAFNLAEQIRETVAILTYGPTDEHVSVSLGISTYPDLSSNPDEITRQAHSAMERAQAEGKNKTVLYTPE